MSRTDIVQLYENSVKLLGTEWKTWNWVIKSKLMWQLLMNIIKFKYKYSYFYII